MKSTNTTPSMSPEDIRSTAHARAVEAHIADQQQSEQSVAGGFRFMTASEMLKEPKPTNWLIRDYLEGSTLTYIYGEPGCMKTFLTLDMGLCVASGTSWHDHSVKKGPVLFIIGEGHQGFGKRVKAWCQDHHVDPDTALFAVSSVAAQFLDPISAEAVTVAISAFAEHHSAPSLVVVDTMNRNYGPGDENSTKDMTAFVHQLDLIKERFGCAIVVTAHTGHGDKTRVRGSSVLHGAADFAFSLKGTSGMRTLNCEKAKDHEHSPSLSFTPEAVDTGWIDPETGRSITSCVLRIVEGTPGKMKKLAGAKAIAMTALQNSCAVNGGGHASLDEWREEAYRLEISASADQGAKQRAFCRASKYLIDSGDVEESGVTNHFHPAIDWFTSQTARHNPDMSGSCLGHLHQTDKTPPYEGGLLSGVSGQCHEVRG
ncbi:AAA family ATPase [Humidesulfovibrio idahonensis]